MASTYLQRTPSGAGNRKTFTISTWVKVDNIGDDNWRYIFDIGRNADSKRIALAATSSGFVSILNGVSSDIFTVSASSSDTGWQHVVLSWSGTNFAKIYINGSESSETTNISNGTLTLESGDPAVIGKRFSCSEYFPGDLDEIAIWNEALSANEITALYNSGNGLAASSNSGNYTSSGNLTGYWNFNEGHGNIVNDITSNSNDGQLHGAGWSDDSAPLMQNILGVSVSNVEASIYPGVAGDTIQVPVNVDLQDVDLFSVGIRLDGFQSHLQDQCIH